MVSQLTRPANDIAVQSFLAIADTKLAESSDTGLLDTGKAAAAADRRAARQDAMKDQKSQPAKTSTKTTAKKTTAKTKQAQVDRMIDEKNSKASKSKLQKSAAVETSAITVTAKPIDDGIADQPPIVSALPSNVVEIKPGVHIVKPTEASLAVTEKTDKLITEGLKEIAAKSEEKEAAKKSAKVKAEKKPKAEKPDKPAIDHVKMIRPSSAPSEKVKLEDGKTKKIKLNDYTIEAKEKVSAIAVNTKIFHIFTAMSVSGGATLAEITTACGVSMTESYTINRVTMRGYGVKKTTGDDGVSRFSLVLPAGVTAFRAR